ncbi:MAG: family 2A encapsulin nanocompartment cargo protein cysteine desulfurase [Polyangia bacterium]
MTTSDAAGGPSGTAPAVSGLASAPVGSVPAPVSPLASTAGVAPVQAPSLAGWDLSTLAQAMIDVVRDPNAQVFPAAKAGVTPTLSPSSVSEPAIVASTPGVSPSAAPAKSDVPTQLPSVPATPAAPSSAGAIDAVALAEPSADFLRIPLLGEAVPVATSYFLVQTGAPNPDSPSDISLVETKEVTPVSPALNKPLRQAGFDPYAVRREFPILNERVHGRRLVWLDNAATTQKPQTVIDRLSYFYAHENSNVHRAAHTLAARATDAYENARATVARFLGASSAQDIVFVRGATEAINLVAQAWGGQFVSAGDEIVITHLEHHANIVPWQQLCAKTGARLLVAPVNDRGEVILEAYGKLLCPRTKMVALTQVSNALGTITPAQQMVAMAHAVGACTLVDGAQAVAHFPVNVRALDSDFYVFSGHKIYAPTGIGALYGKPEVLDSMPPWQGGGNMIKDVTFARTTYHPAPARFEAGTGNIADAVGLGAALDWLDNLGHERAAAYEHELLNYATAELSKVPGLTIIGTSPSKAGVISFVLAGHKTEELGSALDREGIAVRSGHHCAQPILRRFGLEATVRASLAPYNVCEDIDILVAALKRLNAHG